MARMITNSALREAVEKQTFIKNGKPEAVEGIKYDFHLGNRILKANFGRPIDARDLTGTDLTSLSVEPGEVVFVLTEERLALPENMKAELSPKRKLSHLGISVVGGFCVDPLYDGYLLLGLLNFSSSPFPLFPGKKIIAATFYRLEGDELGAFKKPDAPINDFPDDLVQMMGRYRPVAITTVEKALGLLRSDVDALKREFEARQEWFRKLEESLNRHDGQIEKLIGGLEAEVTAREKGEDKISGALATFSELAPAIEKIDTTLTWLKRWAKIGAWVVGGIGLPLLVIWLANRFGWA